MLVRKAKFVATWVQLSAGSIGNGILTLTGDAGGAVGPDMSGNVDLQGGGPYVFTVTQDQIYLLLLMMVR
jgi:hypothetical protein